MSTIPLRNNTYTVEAFDTNLSGSSFEDCLLADARITYCSMENARLGKVRLNGASLENVSFDNARMERVSFVNCAIKFGRYEGMTIEGVPVGALLKEYFKAHPGERMLRVAEAAAAGLSEHV